DGYLILTTVVKNSKLSAMLKSENVVFVDQSSGFRNEVFVKLDNKEGVRLGIDHLVQKGHWDIGVINLTQTSTTGFERFEGYKAALKKHGIPYNEKYVKFSKSPDWMGTSYNKTEELLRMKNRPTALFPMNGATTIGALHAIRKNGLKIPDDISIIGFDEYYFSELLSPGITSIAQPVEDFGETGMNLLINIIKQELPHRRKIIELKPKLIERNSCKNIL
ncbi:substrate-binding domain-containing protein, partial [Candidatus Latescibacterota bacterium]